MGKEIVINAEKEQTRIAIIEDGELAELYFENTENERTIGDIYLGRVRRIMPSIKAAFVDIGQKQDAFLHFSDLAENLEALLEFADQDNPQVSTVTAHAEHHRSVGKRHRPRGARRGKGSDNAGGDDGAVGQKHQVADARTRSKRRAAQRRRGGKPSGGGGSARNGRSSQRGPVRGSPDLLKRGQRILVKVAKEPISNKGSRVSTNISLAGRFLVLVPLADYTAVSKKITSPKERRRLRALAKMLVPDGFGVIVRTVAEGKDAKSLDTDLRLLLEKWHKIEKKLAGRPDGPMKVHVDVNMASSIIRDLFSSDFDRILVDDHRSYRNIKSYIQAVAPQLSSTVQLHKSKKHIFEITGLQKDIEEVFDSRVELPSGGYLFIERTEAMHVVDVNSGRAGRGMNQEENSCRVNLEAARAIAKQVRLRDLGGIIVIDFIDMRDERNKKKVFDELRNQFRTDRAVTKILPMSDFGLMQITRQRLRPSLTTTFSGPDATSNGDGASAEAAPAQKQTDHRKQGGRQGRDGREKRQSRDGRDKREGRDGRDKREGGEQREGREKQETSGSRSVPDQRLDVGPEDLVRQIEQWITVYRKQKQRGTVTLRVHPFTAAYLTRKVPTYPTRWFLKHRVRLRMEIDKRVHPMAFVCLDARSGKDITPLGQRRPEAPSQEKKKQG